MVARFSPAFVGACASLVAAVVGRAAAAAEPTPAGQAELAGSLAETAEELLATGTVDAACDAFAQSVALDPKPQRYVALGGCQERAGKPASAWVSYRRAARAAEEVGLNPKQARELAARLEPSLSRIKIIVPSAGSSQPLEVWLDGKLLRPEALGFPVPVDPGAHEISVLSRGRAPWSVKVGLTPASITEVMVPVLAPLAEPAPRASTPEGEPARVSVPAPVASPHTDRTDEDPGRTQRTTAWVLGGAGIGGVALGTFFSLRARSIRNDMDAYCVGNTCPEREIENWDRAQRNANYASWSFGLGATSLAAGVVVYALAPSRKQSALNLAPAIGPGSAALLAAGRF